MVYRAPGAVGLKKEEALGRLGQDPRKFMQGLEERMVGCGCMAGSPEEINTTSLPTSSW
jgi:hypothetical protein